MGSICSCLCLDDLEEYIHSDASIHRRCSCFRVLAQRFIQVYTTFLQREEVQAIPLVEQGMNSSTSTIDTALSNTFHSPPRPLPYDDPRCFQVQHRREKLCHSHEESEVIRGSDNDTNLEMSTTTKCSGSYEGKSNLNCSKSMLNNTLKNATDGMPYSFPSYEVEDEYEDMCPTCLEEYTYENPRIIMKCSHHFHLSCIYEWKERSELCPVCGKVMVFDET